MKKGVLFLLFYFLSIAITFGCDCETVEGTLQSDYDKSVAIFVGKVISIKEYTSKQKEIFSYYVINFEVKETLKGKSVKKIQLITEGSNCGVGYFQVGHSQLIYTFKNEKEHQLEYHQCFRQGLGEEGASKEITQLRKMRK